MKKSKKRLLMSNLMKNFKIGIRRNFRRTTPKNFSGLGDFRKSSSTSFDEPTADIDIAGQESIYKMLHKLHRELNLSIILVSHDLNIVYRYAHKVICLNRKKSVKERRKKY